MKYEIKKRKNTESSKNAQCLDKIAYFYSIKTFRLINKNLVLYQLTSDPILYFLNFILVETANKMKFIIFAVVLCLTAYQIFAANPKVKVDTWGRITNRVLDTKRVTESSIPWMVKTKTLTFPGVRQIITQN